MKYYNDIPATERVHRSLTSTLLVLLMLLPTMVWGQTPITNIAGLNAMTENGNYIITADIEDASTYTTKTSFTGTLTAQAKADGTFPVISGLTKPLFTTATGATISNIMLKNVNISQDGDVGAIACTANGATKIYNCGILPTTPKHDTTLANRSKVGSSDGQNCGSLVGMLAGTARVINCFSYANITKGGTKSSSYFVGGLVGNNSTTSTQSSLNTVVVNCMFYGDIDTASANCARFSPVYGNNAITNASSSGINPYDFYCEDAKFPIKYKGQGTTPYKQSWPVAVEYLTRFEYYRSIFNSNRQLCAYWVTGHTGTEQTAEDTALIAKWVLDPSIAPYPILKKWGKYPSIINPDPTRTWDPEADNGAGAWQTRSTAAPYRGKSHGTLSVTVKPGNRASTAVQTAYGASGKSISLTITEMDTLNYDYGYYKVQLPYYNELFGNPASTNHDVRYGGNYKDSVVTGWKVTAVTTKAGYNDTVCFEGPWAAVSSRVRYRKKTRAWESGYNFADRKCTSKDLYVTSGRVFAQGGFYYVPDSVTSITIEAYWGKAVYLHNTGHYIDRVNITNSSGDRTVGSPFASADSLHHKFNGRTIYDAWHTAVTNLATASTVGSGDSARLSLSVYDQAIVLLSNFQLKNQNGAVGYDIDNKWHPYTLMSIDQDLDNEPDYCFELQFRKDWGRPGIQPIRFDFLPVTELGMAVRHSTQMNTIGIFIPQGHFEITETSFMPTTQFEYEAATTKVAAPVILNGGNFDQIVVRKGPKNITQYFIMGGHFRMHRFTPGAHTNPNDKPLIRLCAVNAIGGEYPEFYLSGIYRPDLTPTSVSSQGNPHCYTNGGRFDTIAGAGYDKILGSITFKIDHSLIGEFYGGGINGSKPVGGSINVTIDNSLVRKYCGGPKVGEMTSGTTVITHATGTHFGRYYGGGNGGTSYYREQGYDGNDLAVPNPSDSSHWANYCKNSNCTQYGPFNPLNTITTGATIPATKYDITETNKGYHALYEFECFVSSNGLAENPTLRTYTHWAQFGTTRTGSVTNVLDSCIIDSNFYGGGNLGNVGGDALGTCGIESTLTRCTIKGSVFGGGFSGKIEPFRIHDKKSTVFPVINDAGVMENGYLKYLKNDDGTDRYYTWSNVREPNHDTATHATFQGDDGKWYCYTRVPLTGLGAVSGNVTLTIGGNTTIGTLDNGNLVEGTGNVYGGGDESAVNGNTTVKLQDGAHVLGNVYGGGNNGTVVGKSSVTIQNP